MKKYIFYCFVLYWLSVLLFSTREKEFKGNFIGLLIGIIIPRDYNMYVDFPTRKVQLYYYFKSDKDIIKIDATKKLQQIMRAKMPFVQNEFIFQDDIFHIFRLVDNNYTKLHWDFVYKNKYPIEKANALALKENLKVSENEIKTLKKYRKIFVKLCNIDTLKYNNYSFEMVSYPIIPIKPIENNYYQIMGKQKVLTYNK